MPSHGRLGAEERAIEVRRDRVRGDERGSRSGGGVPDGGRRLFRAHRDPGPRSRVGAGPFEEVGEGAVRGGAHPFPLGEIDEAGEADAGRPR